MVKFFDKGKEKKNVDSQVGKYEYIVYYLEKLQSFILSTNKIFQTFFYLTKSKTTLSAKALLTASSKYSVKFLTLMTWCFLFMKSKYLTFSSKFLIFQVETHGYCIFHKVFLFQLSVNREGRGNVAYNKSKNSRDFLSFSQ